MTQRKNKLRSRLEIRALELYVNLGWRKKERGTEQAVLLDCDIDFGSPPKACKTDELEDTICYAELIEEIRTQVAAKNYRLIEHLAFDIYQIVKGATPKQTKLGIRLTKYPKIDGLTGGTCFCYEDK